MNRVLLLVILIWGVNCSLQAQKLYVGGNLSLSSSHYRLPPFQHQYQPFMANLITPGTNIYVGYKFDGHNTIQLNQSLFSNPGNESIASAPKGYYTLIPVSNTFQIKYLRQLHSFTLINNPLLLNASAAVVVQHLGHSSGNTFEPQYLTLQGGSRTIVMGQAGLELEWVLNNYSLVAGYHITSSPVNQTSAYFFYSPAGKVSNSVPSVLEYTTSVSLGMRWYILKRKFE